MHCDAGFFTRETQKVLTCWLVFTDVPLDKGPLFVIESSHKYEDIYKKYYGFDVDKKLNTIEHNSASEIIGDGLINMKERARIINAELIFNFDNGTEIKLIKKI